jgi:arginase
MNGVRLIQVPYHLGREGELIGAGPPVLAEAIGGESVVVERPGDFRNEVGASVAIARELAEVVRETVAAGAFPLVLAGNCSTSIGTVTGLDREVGVIWFDAHGDLHTPDTSPTGFFDGFAFRLLLGEGWDELRRDFKVVPRARALLVGARDFDPTEPTDVVRRAGPDDLDEALTDLDVDAVYVHVDLDVLDPSEGRANRWAVDGGLTAEELGLALDKIAARFDIAAAAFTAYDPAEDPERRIPKIAASVVPRLVRAEVRP